MLDVNYGGSTGYGRAYRERLRGQWGVVDVDDCVNGALHLVQDGLADGERLVIDKRDCTVALDGERAFAIRSSQQLEMEVRRDGPPVVDVNLALKVAARRGLFNLTQGN